MLLSAAEKDSGVIPGPQPSRIKIDPYAFNRNRRNHHWRNFQLGYYPTPQPATSFPGFWATPTIKPTYPWWYKPPAPGSGYTRLSGLGDIAPVDVTPAIDLNTGTFYFPPVGDSSGFPPQDFSPQIQPVEITPQVIDPGVGTSSTTYADFLQPIMVTPAVTDPTAGFITPTAPDIQPPSFTISDQAPASPVAATPTPSSPPGTSGSTDYFGDFLKLVGVAGQTFVGYTAAQHGYVPGVTGGGIVPGAPVGGQLTPAQYAMMTPTQRAQYAAMYPGSIPGSSPDILSQLFGSSGSSSSMMTWLLLGGAALTMVLVLKK